MSKSQRKLCIESGNLVLHWAPQLEEVRRADDLLISSWIAILRRECARLYYFQLTRLSVTKPQSDEISALQWVHKTGHKNWSGSVQKRTAISVPTCGRYQPLQHNAQLSWLAQNLQVHTFLSFACVNKLTIETTKFNFKALYYCKKQYHFWLIEQGWQSNQRKSVDLLVQQYANIAPTAKILKERTSVRNASVAWASDCKVSPTLR